MEGLFTQSLRPLSVIEGPRSAAEASLQHVHIVPARLDRVPCSGAATCQSSTWPAQGQLCTGAEQSLSAGHAWDCIAFFWGASHMSKPFGSCFICQVLPQKGWLQLMRRH